MLNLFTSNRLRFFSLTRCNADFHKKFIKILIYYLFNFKIFFEFINTYILHLISNLFIFYMYVCMWK